MERFRSWPFISFSVLLAGLWFSYHPVVTFGTREGIHLDGSLIYLVAVIAAAASSFLAWQRRRALWHDPAWLLLIIFSTYVTVTTLWSPNPFRAVLSTAFLWLMVAVSTLAIIHLPALTKRSVTMRRILLGGLIVSCVWAMWQIIADAAGLSPAYTLLPEAYRSSVFGFARPTAFALEPQFFASLLLAPFGWFLYRTLVSPDRHAGFGLVLTTGMLVLTLSRGGLLAAGIMTLLLVAICCRQWKTGGLALGSMAAGAVIALLLITTAATINQRDDVSGRDAAARSLNHLSLGTLNIPEKPSTPASESPKRPDSKNADTSAKPSDGYVKSSTTSRLTMSQKALEIWRGQPGTVLFGVGVGGFGKTLHRDDPSQPIGAVTNNYFTEMLVELGLIGIALFAGFIGWLLYRLSARRQWLIIALVTGFLVQWCFFSGNANVIHVWVIIGVAIAVSVPARTRRLLQ